MRLIATNYVLLGLAIEKASGMTYRDFVRKHQFGFKLTNTFFMDKHPVAYTMNKTYNKEDKLNKIFLKDRSHINPTELAQGYKFGLDNKNTPEQKFDPSAYFANGSITNAYDISIWDVGLAGNMLVKNKESRDFLYSAAKLTSGKNVH